MGLFTNPLTSSGTPGYVPYFNPDSRRLANSLLYQTGGMMGLGTEFPSDDFHIIGGIQVDDGADTFYINATSGFYYSTSVANGSAFYISTGTAVIATESGGHVEFQTGYGAESDLFGSPGGSGGNYSFTTGGGGNAATGVGAGQGGNGGLFQFQTGEGGVASDDAQAGEGGAFVFAAGYGGAGTATQLGGSGGTLSFTSGSPGVDNGAGTGNYGNINFSAGSTTLVLRDELLNPAFYFSTNKAGGVAWQVQTGAGTLTQSGGHSTFNTGNGGDADALITSAGEGGLFTITLGSGGNASTGTGSAEQGGSFRVNAGFGGNASATGLAGIGGKLEFFSGQGGVGSAALVSGSGGEIIFSTGDTGVDGGAGVGLAGTISFKIANILKVLIDEVGHVGILTGADADTAFQVKGEGNTSGTFSAKFENSDGNPMLYIRDDGRIGVGVANPSMSMAFDGDGVKVIGMERRTTAGAGFDFETETGGCKAGETDTNGGNLLLKSGIATGTGSSQIWFMTAVPAGVSGTGDNPPTLQGVINGDGNFGLGTSVFGASMKGGVAIKNNTAPTGGIADVFQMYSADIVAGNAAPHFRTEVGDTIKLYKTSTGWTTSNVTTDRVLNADSYTADELADVLCTLIEDLKLTGLISA